MQGYDVVTLDGEELGTVVRGITRPPGPAGTRLAPSR
jgi:hypothetical protein